QESNEKRAETLEISIPPGPRLGDLVVEADHVGKGYGDRVLIDDLGFKLPRGGIVGVIGPNGAGKTTLFRMIVGQETPDKDTLRALEDALLDFAGSAVIISHDRWFLDRIATHVLAFEDEGRVVWFEGNYADYEADRKRRLGAEAERPHRLRHKKLKT